MSKHSPLQDRFKNCLLVEIEKNERKTFTKYISGGGGIWTHTSKETDALNQTCALDHSSMLCTPPPPYVNFSI